MELLYLFFGLLLGALVAGLLVYNRFVSGQYFMPKEEVEKKYIHAEIFAQVKKQFEEAKQTAEKKELVINDLGKDLAAQEQINSNLEEKLNTQKAELAELQRRFQTEFENIANRLLEEKSQKFTAQNATQLDALLTPLKEKIKSFEESVESKFLYETRERASLKTELEQLHRLNEQLSQDAHNLVAALRGDNKTQGDWGEWQLQMLLEKSGLLRGVHFQMQESYADGTQQKRPDFVIQLPENKQVVIDSKVSLTAYEKFFNADEPVAQARFLKAHIDSLRQHVRGLSEKNYAHLYALNSPDYVIMFVAIEPALAVAMREDASLFTDALERNVVVVTASTLLATMRTVSFTWKQENQKRNVLEIARQSGLLYDKFVAFLDDLKLIGQRLDMAQSSYHDALNKLTDSRKFGDTLIGRAEKLRELGAKSAKKIPQEWLENTENRNDELTEN